MNDNFWESLRVGFMELRAECAIDPPPSPAGRLTAIWTACREQKWRLNYHNGKDGSGVGKRFGWAAESAAAKLGFLGSGDAAVSYWLDELRSNAPVSYIRTINLRDNGKADEVYSVEILDVCGLSADYCRKCHADQIRALGASADNRSGRQGSDMQGTPVITSVGTLHLLELSPKLQDAFEAARTRAEMEYATRADRFPNNPQFADIGLHLPVLIHAVFFAFCVIARNAGATRLWTTTRIWQATNAAWPAICDFYFVRERGAWSEEQKLSYRGAVWQTVADDPRWKQHLAEIATLSERDLTASPDASDGSPDDSRHEIVLKPMDVSGLPALDAQALERVEQGLRNAQSYLNGASPGESKAPAARLYFDALAWECVLTASAAEFEVLIEAIGTIVCKALDCSAKILIDRKRIWIDEARDRAANDIVGNKIPIRIDESHQSVFRELGQQFRVLPGPDLDAIFIEAGQSIFLPGPDQAAHESLSAHFERLARRAMASLAFRFTDTSRAVYYWLVLLRQQIKPSSTWALRQVCLASADLCSELERRKPTKQVCEPSLVYPPLPKPRKML